MNTPQPYSLASGNSLEERLAALPPLAGADPITDPAPATQGDPAATTAPVEGTPAQDVTDAPADGGTSAPGTTPETTPDDEFVQAFRLADIQDPQVRSQVELYVNQARADYTRKTQEVAAQRREAQDAIDLMGRLETPESRDEALNELLDRYGLELVGDETDPEDHGQPEATGDPVADRIAALEADAAARRDAEAQRQQIQARQDQENQVLSHVDDALEAHAESRGLDELPGAERRGILAMAAANPTLENGLPNMELAISEWQAVVSAGIQAYIASKDVEATDASGSAGQSQIDLRDTQQRMARAEAVAERAYARHA